MIVLRGGTVVDGTGAEPVRKSALVIRDRRIEAVTTADAGGWPADAEVIDVSGMTVLPGLIDCHDHMAIHSYDMFRRWGLDEPASARTLRTARAIENMLARGYTAVRDAAGLDVGFRIAIEEGLLRGPRLLTAIAIAHLGTKTDHREDVSETITVSAPRAESASGSSVFRKLSTD